MRHAFLSLLLFLAPGLAAASADGGFEIKHARIDPTDKASLQRGARTFANYCLSCHSASYMRYKRLMDDLGVSEKVMQGSLMFASDKIYDGMDVAFRPEDGRKWFGVPPPDLSVTARARGANWLYTYFTSFYRDDSKPTGVNNAVFPDVAMPHVLWREQGWQDAVYVTEKGADGKPHKRLASLKLSEPGAQTAAEYDHTVRDLVAFLVYLGEPAELQRKELGSYVLLFILFFAGLAYLLKREYWRDVH